MEFLYGTEPYADEIFSVDLSAKLILKDVNPRYGTSALLKFSFGLI